ncbi:hypothetical protein B0T26DRAFT_487301 [Lasiosphaeria miniovina]|uniref:Uncharacterized protein n=1 Tax=Lasiosphaeria miniovina TaxID=1954250 RepID=A0AA39ZSS6_9PEZI|nr:uncharacterized protein B0T26DRAFT_487301 [Lasiosphaeria miniovina]KAK0702974.1 hypothetical protein B0T26DRAFT_487301 [Lasiosphaeria miniovina]
MLGNLESKGVGDGGETSQAGKNAGHWRRGRNLRGPVPAALGVNIYGLRWWQGELRVLSLVPSSSIVSFVGGVGSLELPLYRTSAILQDLAPGSCPARKTDHILGSPTQAASNLAETTKHPCQARLPHVRVRSHNNERPSRQPAGKDGRPTGIPRFPVWAVLGALPSSSKFASILHSCGARHCVPSSTGSGIRCPYWKVRSSVHMTALSQLLCTYWVSGVETRTLPIASLELSRRSFSSRCLSFHEAGSIQRSKRKRCSREEDPATGATSIGVQARDKAFQSVIGFRVQPPVPQPRTGQRCSGLESE